VYEVKPKNSKKICAATQQAQTKPKSLAMLKMEKNFVAHIEKKYPRYPYSQFHIAYLIQRLKEEVEELEAAWNDNYNIEAMKNECADISNIVDYIFERLARGLIL